MERMHNPHSIAGQVCSHPNKYVACLHHQWLDSIIMPWHLAFMILDEAGLCSILQDLYVHLYKDQRVNHSPNMWKMVTDHV